MSAYGPKNRGGLAGRLRLRLGALAATLLAASAGTAPGQVVINEFMAVNDGGLTNALGQTADWIELYNTSNGAVNLAGWRLTDDAAKPSKWVFPTWTIPAQGFALVYADNSSVAVTQGELHASFQLSGNGEYLGLYRPNGTVASEYRPAYPAQTANVSFGLRPDTGAVFPVNSNTLLRLLIPTNGTLDAVWTGTNFNDSAWARVAQPVGYESSPSNYAALIRTTVPLRTMAAYVRMPFVLDDPATVDELLLRLQFDDGVVIHLNGTALESENAPADAVWNSPALGQRDPEDAVAWAEFDLSGRRDLLVAGTNVLAVHVLNVSRPPILFNDLLLGCELEVRRYAPSVSGEWRFFSLPTPGARNVLGESDAQPPVAFAPSRGFYEQPVTVTLSTPVENAVIRYTLNNTLPDATNGLVYGAPLMVSSTTVVRARAFKPNLEPSRVQTHTYAFLSDIISNPVMRTIVTLNPTYGPQMRASLLAAPAFFFTVPGGVDKFVERAASIEYFDAGGAAGFQIDGGAKRYGDGSLVKYPKTSIRMYFRSRYGAGKLKYPLFAGHPYGLAPTEEFDSLNLRSSQDGYEGAGLQIRTAWFDDAQLAMGRMGLHDRMVHAYVSGVYEGLFTLRENPREPYAAAYLGGDETNYTFKSETTPSPIWTTVLNLTNDLPALRSYVDEESLHDYMLLSFWGANGEWSGSHNWLTVGPCRPDQGGFQFFPWDVDYSLYLNVNNVDNGVPDGVFDRLMTDPDSRQRFADHVYRQCFNEGPLTPNNAWALLSYRADQARLPIVAESARWHNHLYPGEWSNNVDAIRSGFFDQRTPILMDQLREKGWYPPLDPPVFSQHGGAVAPGFLLILSASNTITYTLDGSDPREWGTGAAVGEPYTGPIPITLATTVKARARDGAGEWSALSEAHFAPEAPAALQVSELMFHPRNPPPGVTNWSAQDYEFIELRNVGNAAAGLTGVRFAEGITFDFTAGAMSSLDPGAYVLVVANLEAFRSRYTNWPALNIAGEYQRVYNFPIKMLSDGGEEVRIEDGLGRTLVRFAYNDGRGWPEAAGGAGHSLVPQTLDDPNNALDYGGNWRASAYVDGSPGAPDPAPSCEAVLNEVMAHTDLTDTNYPGYDSNDWLELYNPGTSAVSLAGWYLSDDRDALDKWAIPPTYWLAPGAWVVFDEVSGFHSPITNGFGLNKAGETVFLSHLPGGGRDRVVDAVRFEGQENGAGLGRHADGQPWWYALTPPTPWAANAAPTAGVVIGEFMYHPVTTGEEALVEFVEAYNAGGVTAVLWNADGPWRLDGGLAYTFPVGTALAPRERLVVVGFDPVSNVAARANFLATYGLTNGAVRLLGPYSGQLDNHGERLALEKPLAPDLPEDPMIWVIVDEIIYFDRAPWSPEADGTGRSLQRVSPWVSGRDPANWTAAYPATPGSSATDDTDGDGLPDAWERLYFQSTARDGMVDYDGDGMPDSAEFAAGTDPTNAASCFRLTISGTNNAVVVGFEAILGEPGSEEQVRFYTLESATGLARAAWQGVSGYTNLQGLQGDVRVTNPATPGPTFYRGHVWLEPVP
jgi:hypothetical protein